MPFHPVGADVLGRPEPAARREESATSLRTGERKAMEGFLVFKDPERLVEKWRES